MSPQGRDSDDFEAQDNKPAKILTAEEMRRKVEDMKAGKGLDTIEFDTDEQGNARFLGMKIDRNLLPALQSALTLLKTGIIQKSDKIFLPTSNFLTKRLGFKNPTAKLVAAGAEDALRWGTLFADQFYNLAHISASYQEKRRELYKELAPLIQAGANYKNNEVIRAAFGDLHREWVTEMKLLAGDIPAMAAMGFIAWEGQVAAMQRRKMQSGDTSALVSDIENAIAAQTDQKVEKQSVIEATFDKKREEYIKKGLKAKQKSKIRGYYKHGEFADADELSDEFDKIADQIREDYRTEETEQKKHQYGHGDPRHKDDKNETLRTVGTTLLQVGGEAWKSTARATAAKHHKRANTWEMIKHLKDEVERQCGGASADGENKSPCAAKSADEIMVSDIGGHGGKDLTLKEYIAEIFQQMERDRNPGKIFKEKGKEINPLGESLVEQLGTAVDKIADAVASRHIDATALVMLAGENKIIKHEGSRRIFANAEQVDNAIEALAPAFNTHETVTPEKFFADFADPALVEGTLKKTLDSLKGEEQALFASLIPENIVKRAGHTKKEIVAWNKQAHEPLYNFVAANVLALAHTAEKEPEKLKKAGLRDEDLSAITELAESIKAEDMAALRTAVDSHAGAFNAVRTELLSTLAGPNGMTTWAERVGKSKELQLNVNGAAKEPPSKNLTQEQALEEGEVVSAVERVAKGREKPSDAVVPGGPA